MPPNLGGFFMVRSYYPSECHADYFDFERIEDRKSGSAGMPRPISYAVFCLKKKKLPTDGRRRVGVDGFGLPALSGLPRLPVPLVLGGLLRLRVQGPARRLVGHPPQRRAHHLPELGLPDPAPHLRRLPLREGRVTGRVRVDAFLIDADLDAALRDDARRGLTSVPKELPPKWFYDERGSQLFDEITRLPEYYPTRRRPADRPRPGRHDRQPHP